MKQPSLISRIKSSTGRYPVITLSCMVTGLLLASIYIYITPRQFESTAVLEYIRPMTNQGAQVVLTSGQTPVTEELTSDDFVTKAITGKVNPVTCYIEQDFKTSPESYSFPYIVKHTVLGSHFQEQLYTIIPVSDESFELVSTVHGLTRVKNGNFDEEIIDQDLALTISKKKQIPYQTKELLQPAKYSFKIQTPASLAQAQLQKKGGIKAAEVNGVVTISARHESPVMAQEITRAIAGHFLATRNAGISKSNTSTETIDEQLAAMSLQLEITENQIAEYKRENNITNIEFDTQKSLDILKSLELQKSQLELNLAALNNTSKYLRKNRQINNSNVEYGTIADPVFSEQIATLNAKYEIKESGLATAATESEIEAIKTSIAERIRNTRKKTTLQINKLQLEIAAIHTQLSTIPDKANTLSTLDRKLALDRKVYDLLAEKRAQALVTGTGVSTNGRILKPASNPTSPAFPAPWMLLLTGVIAGLIGSIPVTLLADKISSQRLGNRQEIAQQSRIPFIGTISQGKTGGDNIGDSLSALCTRVLLRPEVKIITFASTNKGDGKTFIATNFAQAFAAMDKKVLVIDMNAEQPAVAAHFNVTPERSLSDVLAGSCDIHDAICLTSYPNLDVLECGTLNSGVNSLLASGKRTAIVESLRNHYDIIVTDTPDIGTRIDALPLMKLSDLNLFVVRANTTRKQSLITAEQINRDYEIQNLFYLLNSVKHTNNQHTDNTRRSRIRKLNKTETQPKEAYVPSMLKKIALWFY